MAEKEEEVRITLGLSEWVVAVAIGIVRHGICLFKGMKPTWQEGDANISHLQGALAEAAYFKWRGIWWNPALNNGTGPDAPHNIQIRSTARGDRAFYKVKPGDPDDQVAVFIESQERSHWIVGWMPVSTGKQVGKFCDPGGRSYPCYQVLREQMMPPQSLRPGFYAKCNVHGEHAGEICPTCHALEATASK